MNDKLTTSPLIALALMVKNEASAIEATLASYSEAGIRHFFVLDTGSTDDTMALAWAFFKKHNLKAYIEQEPFVDFSTSRNKTLERAEDHFPDIPFLLMPDAEWFLHGGPQLLDFCSQEKNTESSNYLISIVLNDISFYASRLFRTSSQVRFSGVVHEAPTVNVDQRGTLPASIFFEVKPNQQGMEKSIRRWRQDLKMLFAAHIDEPDNARTAFYLGQTYECLNDIENACRIYRYRESLKGWPEEHFITLLRLGQLAERLHHDNKEKGWAVAMDYYLKAHAIAPHRAEPLVKIADHYWPDNKPSCYLFIRAAYDLPYPESDILFVEKNAYVYDRYEIMSRCAWYAGEFILGEQATQLALKLQPNLEHLKKNLELYQQRLLELGLMPSNTPTTQIVEREHSKVDDLHTSEVI